MHSSCPKPALSLTTGPTPPARRSADPSSVHSKRPRYHRSSASASPASQASQPPSSRRTAAATRVRFSSAALAGTPCSDIKRSVVEFHVHRWLRLPSHSAHSSPTHWPDDPGTSLEVGDDADITPRQSGPMSGVVQGTLTVTFTMLTLDPISPAGTATAGRGVGDAVAIAVCDKDRSRKAHRPDPGAQATSSGHPSDTRTPDPRPPPSSPDDPRDRRASSDRVEASRRSVRQELASASPPEYPACRYTTNT